VIKKQDLEILRSLAVFPMIEPKWALTRGTSELHNSSSSTTQAPWLLSSLHWLCRSPAAELDVQEGRAAFRDGLDIVKARLDQSTYRLGLSLKHVEGLLQSGKGPAAMSN
jgi:hypothetical protein